MKWGQSSWKTHKAAHSQFVCDRHAVEISRDSAPGSKAQALNALGAALYTSGTSAVTPLKGREQQCEEAHRAFEGALASVPSHFATIFNLSKIQVSFAFTE